MSQNFVSGTNFFVSSSSKTYVPAPHAKWMDSSYFGLLENASMTFVSGMQLGTGNQSSIVTSPPVCSSIRCMQSGIVMRYFSRSCLPIRPVRDTGWKLTACTTSMFFWAYRMMPPSSWSLIDLMTVGTKTTVVPVLRQLSSAWGISQWFFGLVLAVTPSKLR